MTVNQVQSILTSFQTEPDKTRSDDFLECLIRQHAEPLINRIIRSVMPSLWDRDSRPANDDIRGEIVVKLVRKLQELKAEPAGASVSDFLSYVAVVSYNTCYSYLRSGKPERSRLRNKVRYALVRAPGLAIWEIEGRVWLCGFSEWQLEGAVRCRSETVAALSSDPEPLERMVSIYGSGAQESPIAVLTAIFQAVGAPVEFDELVDLLAVLWGVKDSSYAQDLEMQHCRLFESLTSKLPLHSEQVENRWSLRIIWNEIRGLPRSQRAALLLGLKDDRGVDCVSLLGNAGIATPSEVSAAIGIEPACLIQMWDELPLDDSTIALTLGTTRQQVANLRKSARKRLARRLAAAGMAR